MGSLNGPPFDPVDDLFDEDNEDFDDDNEDFDDDDESEPDVIGDGDSVGNPDDNEDSDPVDDLFDEDNEDFDDDDESEPDAIGDGDSVGSFPSMPINQGPMVPLGVVSGACVLPSLPFGQGCMPRVQPWTNPIPLPIDSSDVYRRSAACLFALNRLEEVVAKIVPRGQRQDAVYLAGNLVVALDFTPDPWFGMQLAPGAWVYETGLCGFDLLGLYAQVHGVTYSHAAAAIFDACRDRCENGSQQVRKLPQWSQELSPLHNQVLDPLVSGNPHLSDVCVFLNPAGNAIASVTRVRTTSGEVARVWRCLWRRSGSYRAVWAEISPSKAFFLNADLMRQFPGKPVHVRLDPFDAKQAMASASSWIFTALPSGPSSIPNADLALLQGRDVRVDLDPPGVEGLWKIDAALMSAGVKSVGYALPKRSWSYRSASDAAVQAEADGFVLKGQKAKVAGAMDVVVSEPGQPIPGSEIKREMLISPWLKSGYLAWIYAPPETGKSWLANGLAQMLAAGHGVIGEWRPAKQANVLLVDGEMLPDELEKARRLVSAGLAPDKSEPKFSVLCAKAQPSGLIDIETEEWQHKIEKLLVGKNLLVLDNAQSLMGNGGSHLKNVQGWFRRLIQRGIAVLVLDHTNADGELQGSIAKLRIANVVIALECDDEEAKANGVTSVRYCKWRYGPRPIPFILKRCHHDDAVTFEVLGKTNRPSEVVIPERIQKMARVAFAHEKLKLSYRKIEEEYEIPASTASDLLKAVQGLQGDDLRLFNVAMTGLMGEAESVSDED